MKNYKIGISITGLLILVFLIFLCYPLAFMAEAQSPSPSVSPSPSPTQSYSPSDDTTDNPSPSPSSSPSPSPSPTPSPEGCFRIVYGDGACLDSPPSDEWDYEWITECHCEEGNSVRHNVCSYLRRIGRDRGTEFGLVNNIDECEFCGGILARNGCATIGKWNGCGNYYSCDTRPENQGIKACVKCQSDEDRSQPYCMDYLAPSDRQSDSRYETCKNDCVYHENHGKPCKNQGEFDEKPIVGQCTPGPEFFRNDWAACFSQFNEFGVAEPGGMTINWDEYEEKRLDKSTWIHMETPLGEVLPGQDPDGKYYYNENTDECYIGFCNNYICENGRVYDPCSWGNSACSSSYCEPIKVKAYLERWVSACFPCTPWPLSNLLSMPEAYGDQCDANPPNSHLCFILHPSLWLDITAECQWDWDGDGGPDTVDYSIRIHGGKHEELGYLVALDPNGGHDHVTKHYRDEFDLGIHPERETCVPIVGPIVEGIIGGITGKGKTLEKKCVLDEDLDLPATFRDDIADACGNWDDNDPYRAFSCNCGDFFNKITSRLGLPNKCPNPDLDNDEDCMIYAGEQVQGGCP